MSEASPDLAKSRSEWRSLVGRVAFAALGVALLVALVVRVGVEALRASALDVLPMLPLAFLLEALRIGCDAWATRLVLGARGASIPTRVLFEAQLVGHAVMNVFPAGRSASEAAKASLLHRYVGAAEAVAMGTANQANVLLSSAVFSLGCALAAGVMGLDARLVVAIVVHFVVLFASGVGMRLASTHPRIEAFFIARFPKLGHALARFAESSRGTPLVALGPLAVMMLGRLAQTLEYGLLARAAGLAIGPLGAFAVQGTNLVAAAVGVAMPGQVGSAEAVFALAAEALGTTEARAMTIALAAHAVGLVWVVLGLVRLASWRASRGPDAASSNGSDAGRAS